MHDLAKANELISVIAKHNKYISPVSLDDYELFKSFFEKEPHSYGNSWIYITQGVYGIGPNKLGYKYYDGDNLSIIISYPRLEDPNTLMVYWVRPMGKDITKKIAAISKEIYNQFKVNSYVKKIYKKQLDELIELGFISSENHPWHSFSHAEDDTYPEMIFDVAKSLEKTHTAGKKKNIKRSYKESIKFAKSNKIEVNEVDFKENAWQITNKFFEDRAKYQTKPNLSNPGDYFNPIYSNDMNKSIMHKIFWVNGEPKGYYILEKMNNKFSSVYALISDRQSYQYLNDYILLNVFQNSPTPFINLGGSEDIGIHNFKKKYKPIEENQMFWAYSNL